MPRTPCGSNLGPTNKALIERVKGDVDKLKPENPSAPVPIDLVTTSGSGLDPAHLAGGGAVPGAARREGAQPAGRSRAPAGRRAYEGRFLGLLGEPRVNVLALNLALDRRGSADSVDGLRDAADEI